MVIKVTVGTKMRGKVIWCSLTTSVICALYVFSVGIFEEEKKKAPTLVWGKQKLKLFLSSH